MRINSLLTESVEVSPSPGADQARRRELMRLIENLEHDLQQVLSALTLSNRRLLASPSSARPHLLSMPELELVRDGLLAELGRAEETLAQQVRTRRAKRALLKRMTEEPVKFRWARVTTVDLGEHGCRSWEVVPQLGPVGMLANWWRVRISSGCP